MDSDWTYFKIQLIKKIFPRWCHSTSKYRSAIKVVYALLDKLIYHRQLTKPGSYQNQNKTPEKQAIKL